MDATTAAIKVSNHIYDDLAFIILSKLPLKSLFRFSCARKSWSVLFQNSYFMDMFRRNFLSKDHSYYNDASLILHHIEPFNDHDETSHVLYSLSGESFENTVEIDWPNPYQLPYRFHMEDGSASVNGIFCIKDGGRVEQREGIEGGTIVLWNPATDECKVVPISPFAYNFPPWRPYIEFHGFGYDQVTDDYKVIRHITFFETRNDWNGPHQSRPDDLWEIYCLKSNKWRKLDFYMPTKNVGVVGVQVYTDGVCHWCTCESKIDDEIYLVSFDLINETFVKTSIPSNIDHIGSGFVFRHLDILNGSICWISSYGDTCTFHISILGQVGIKESWIKLLVLGPLPCVQHPIGIGKKGDIFFWRKDYELVWFNLNTQKIEELGVRGEELCRIIIYKESFLPFERINN